MGATAVPQWMQSATAIRSLCPTEWPRESLIDLNRLEPPVIVAVGAPPDSEPPASPEAYTVSSPTRVEANRRPVRLSNNCTLSAAT